TSITMMYTTSAITFAARRPDLMAPSKCRVYGPVPYLMTSDVRFSPRIISTVGIGARGAACVTGPVTFFDEAECTGVAGFAGAIPGTPGGFTPGVAGAL